LGLGLIELAIGVSLIQLIELYRSRKMEPIYDAAAALIFCAIFVVFTYSTYDFYFVPLAAGLILCLSLARGPFTRALEWRPMVLLGEISFSIYMLYGFVLWLCLAIPASF